MYSSYCATASFCASSLSVIGCFYLLSFYFLSAHTKSKCRSFLMFCIPQTFMSQENISISSHGCLLKSHAGMLLSQIFLAKINPSIHQPSRLISLQLVLKQYKLAPKSKSFLIKVRIVTLTNWINSNFAPSEWQHFFIPRARLSGNCTLTWCAHVPMSMRAAHFQTDGMTKWFSEARKKK